MMHDPYEEPWERLMRMRPVNLPKRRCTPFEILKRHDAFLKEMRAKDAEQWAGLRWEIEMEKLREQELAKGSL
jgi:hypothetical protein